MPARLSQEEVERRIQSLKDRGIGLLSEYAGSSNKCKFICLKPECSSEWATTFSSVYTHGDGCAVCSGKRLNIDKCQDLLNQKNVRLISDFTKVKDVHEFACTTCLHKWSQVLKNAIKNKNGCPNCYRKNRGKALRISAEEIVNRKDQLRYRGIELISEYKGSLQKHDFRCLLKTCGYRWKATFCQVYSEGTSCPKCKGKRPTEEDKLRHESNKILRKRLSNISNRKNISKPYKSRDGKDNELLAFFANQYAQFISDNPKPKSKNWELDHIIPISLFDHTDMEQMKLCWHQNNLQWLEKTVNAKKHNHLLTGYFTTWHYEVLEKLGIQ